MPDGMSEMDGGVQKIRRGKFGKRRAAAEMQKGEAQRLLPFEFAKV
jgi:hypothetical protein